MAAAMRSVPILPTLSSRLEGQLDLAKWLATVAMVIDHAALMFPSQVPHATFRAVGRLAWPLVAWVIAVRLVRKPARTGGYLRRCLAWGCISQPVYWLALEVDSGAVHPFGVPLNIFFTIATGIALWEAGRRWSSGAQEPARVALSIIASMAVVASWWPNGMDYGPVGAVMIPVIALTVPRSLPWSTAVAGLSGALTGVSLVYPFIDTMPSRYVAIFTLAPLVAGWVAWLCLQQRHVAPRLPSMFFYAFFPTHLAVLCLLRAWLERSV